MEWITTTTVLNRLRDAGDDSAWSSFVARFRAPITRFSCRQGLPEAEADDVAQETLMAFLEAYRKEAYQRGRGRLSQYLFGIAHNKILMARRKISAREVQVNAGNDAAGFWAGVPDTRESQDIWDTEWRQSVLAQGLEQVSREVSVQTIEAFRMVVFEQAEPATVAERLGMTRNAVFIAKHRVGSRLRELAAAFDED